jgi:hypothetical protein
MSSLIPNKRIIRELKERQVNSLHEAFLHVQSMQNQLICCINLNDMHFTWHVISKSSRNAISRFTLLTTKSTHLIHTWLWTDKKTIHGLCNPAFIVSSKVEIIWVAVNVRLVASKVFTRARTHASGDVNFSKYWADQPCQYFCFISLGHDYSKCSTPKSRTHLSHVVKHRPRKHIFVA